jgi:hypothetical protein
MSDNRPGRSHEAGDRDGEDGRRVARIRSRQDFWDVPEGGGRRRAHRRSRAGGRRRGRT